jgi:phage baseplate assembly protein W
MPIPQTIRVNPLDLQKNIAIGVSLPFNKPFTSTYTTKKQIKSNLVNLLLTDIGERVMNPNFGCNLKRYLFENINDVNAEKVKNAVLSSVGFYIPEITVTSIAVTPNPDYNSIDVSVNYVLNISQTPDEITVQFN